MSFEDKIARLNQHFFFQEFTYSKNKFHPSPKVEAELADSIIWLDDALVVFQLKERSLTGATTAENESHWFKNKILSLGTRQIRSTLDYLQSYDEIELENHRGHKLHLNSSKITAIHKVICYLADDNLPDKCGSRKFYRSQEASLIHLIQANDYLGIVLTVLTPSELFEYLGFREELIDKWNDVVNSVPESALVGQYICGDTDSPPSVAFLEHLQALEHRIDEWDMSVVIEHFADRFTADHKPTGYYSTRLSGQATVGNESTDYYHIIIELAKLKRDELREFKKRFQLSKEKCRSNESVKPYRLACPRTGCGLVFIPVRKELFDRRLQGLQYLTYACKYDLKLSKCIGVSFALEVGGEYWIEWCCDESPWKFDAELEKQLKENNPFRKVGPIELERYSYHK